MTEPNSKTHSIKYFSKPKDAAFLTKCFYFVKELASELNSSEEFTITANALAESIGSRLCGCELVQLIKNSSTPGGGEKSYDSSSNINSYAGFMLYHPIASLQLGFGFSLEQLLVNKAFQKKKLGRAFISRLCQHLNTMYGTFVEVSHRKQTDRFYQMFGFQQLTTQGPCYQLHELSMENAKQYIALKNPDLFPTEIIKCAFLPLSAILTKPPSSYLPDDTIESSVAKEEPRSPPETHSLYCKSSRYHVKWREIDLKYPCYKTPTLSYPMAWLVISSSSPNTKARSTENLAYRLSNWPGWFIAQRVFNAWSGFWNRLSDFSNDHTSHVQGITHELVSSSRSLSGNFPAVQGFSFVVADADKDLLRWLKDKKAVNYSDEANGGWRLSVLQGDQLNRWRPCSKPALEHGWTTVQEDD